MLEYLEGNRGQWESALFTQCISFTSGTKCQTRMEHFLFMIPMKFKMCLLGRLCEGCKDIDTKPSVVTDCKAGLPVEFGFLAAVGTEWVFRGRPSAPGCDLGSWKGSVQLLHTTHRPSQLHHTDHSSAKWSVDSDPETKSSCRNHADSSSLQRTQVNTDICEHTHTHTRTRTHTYTHYSRPSGSMLQWDNLQVRSQGGERK